MITAWYLNECLAFSLAGESQFNSLDLVHLNQPCIEPRLWRWSRFRPGGAVIIPSESEQNSQENKDIFHSQAISLPGTALPNTNATNKLSLRGAGRRRNPKKNEIAAPFGLAMTCKEIYCVFICYLLRHQMAIPAVSTISGSRPMLETLMKWIVSGPATNLRKGTTLRSIRINSVPDVSQFTALRKRSPFAVLEKCLLEAKSESPKMARRDLSTILFFPSFLENLDNLVSLFYLIIQ